jgi:hypothetical protein
MFDIELINEKFALLVSKNDPVARAEGGIPVRQLSECSVELGGAKGLRIDFDHLSNEYSFRARSTGLELTFKGLRDAPAMCHKGSCYYDLQIGGSAGELQRVLRAVEFISENACPLRKLPF